MRNYKNLFAFILSFFICICAHAQTPADTLTALLLKIDTLQADFTQTITNQKSGKSVQNTSGRMALERPGKFRWETLSPNRQLIIANDSRLWIYDPGLEQVTIQPFHANAGKTPAALLLSDKKFNIGSDYEVTIVPSPMAIAGYQIFQLTPKDSNDTLEKISLAFMMQQIHQMKLEDRLGNITTIDFHDVKTGMPLSASLFTFKIPRNVDVIDETKDRR